MLPLQAWFSTVQEAERTDTAFQFSGQESGQNRSSHCEQLALILLPKAFSYYVHD